MQRSDILRRRPAPLTEADYKRQRDEILRTLDSLADFADTGTLDKEERVKRAQADEWYFAKTYLPHYFRDNEPSEFDTELLQAFDIQEQPVVCTAAAGFGKSTIVLLKVLRWFCFGTHKFIVQNMGSEDKAIMYTQRVLLELQYNRRITHDFGNLVAADASTSDFTAYDPKTHRPRARYAAWGIKKNMAGLVSGESRPDVIICEDLQDRESAENPTQTKKMLKRVADYRMRLADSGWKFIVIGNVICSGSLIDKLIKQTRSWVKIKIPAIRFEEDGSRRSTSPRRFPLAKLDSMKDDLEVGMGESAFLADMMLEPAEAGEEFDDKWFKHWAFLPKALTTKKCHAQLDPSFSTIGDNKALGMFVRYSHTKQRSDYGTWCDQDGTPFLEGDYVILLYIWNRQASIDDMIKECFRCFREYNYSKITIDGTFAQKIIFDREFRSVEKNLGALPIKWKDFTQNKLARIRSLQIPIQRGLILFPPKNTRDVDDAVLQFVRLGKPGVKDDAPDMIAAGYEEVGGKRMETVAEAL